MIDFPLAKGIMVGLMAPLNRFRGLDGVFGFRNLYLVAPIVGLMAGLLSWSIPFGLIVALGYLIWGCFPHGEWLDHNRLPVETDRKYETKLLTYYVAFINKVSFGNDKLAMFIKNLSLGFIFVPLTIWFGLPLWTLLATPILSGLMTLTHEACLKFFASNELSEMANGTNIGAFINIFIFLIGAF